MGKERVFQFLIQFRGANYGTMSVKARTEGLALIKVQEKVRKWLSIKEMGG